MDRSPPDVENMPAADQKESRIFRQNGAFFVRIAYFFHAEPNAQIGKNAVFYVVLLRISPA